MPKAKTSKRVSITLNEYEIITIQAFYKKPINSKTIHYLIKLAIDKKIAIK